MVKCKATVVQSITGIMADMASTAPNSKSILWSRKDETADDALAAIDAGLGIETV